MTFQTLGILAVNSPHQSYRPHDESRSHLQDECSVVDLWNGAIVTGSSDDILLHFGMLDLRCDVSDPRVPETFLH
jgi:hypothetical protein